MTPETLAAAEGYRPRRERGELDRWILSELNRTAAAVVERMDAYDNYAACAALTEFVDALSNWYVRRSRDRFWSGQASADKSDAHWTLYECLLTTCKLIAPFVPFLAEEMWQNLAVAAFADGRRPERPVESVHLCDYPCGDAAVGGSTMLSERMALVREIVSLGRSARMGAKLKVRQPLARVEVILADPEHQRLAGRTRGADLRRIERQAGRVRPAGRPVRHLHGAARPEAARPAAGKTAARVAESCWPRPTAAGCWPSWRARAS